MTSLREQLCKEGFPTSHERASVVALLLQKNDWYDIMVGSEVLSLACLCRVCDHALDVSGFGEHGRRVALHRPALRYPRDWNGVVSGLEHKARYAFLHRGLSLFVYLLVAGRLSCAGDVCCER